MRWLILGGTGLLGKAVVREMRSRDLAPVTIARENADECGDLQDISYMNEMLSKWKPDGVLNAAAMVDLHACEQEPQAAWALHAQLLVPLVAWSQKTNGRLLHISTDHLFAEDGDAKHDETAPVTLCNTYAASKYAGEAIAGTAENALVVRTNFSGIDLDRAAKPFAHWAINAILNHEPMQLFDDYYCSTMDVGTLADCLCDLMKSPANGLLNIGSSEITSKWEFVHMLAAELGVKLDWASAASVKNLRPCRADSLGLDVAMVEKLLGKKMPSLQRVCANLVKEWNEK